MRLRDAQYNDRRFIWEVNNHPSVRRQSIRTDDIPWDAHVAWFDAIQEDAHRHLFIVECESRRAGVVRLDVAQDEPHAELSIAISPDHRGKGLGRASIRQAAALALEDPRVHTVVALIRPDNPASIRAFERAGFAEQRHTTRHGVDLLEYRLSRPVATR